MKLRRTIATLACALGISLTPLVAGPQHTLDAVAFDQRIGASLEEGVRFVNGEGQSKSLARLAAERPLVLVLSWFNCPDLCPMVLDNLAAATGELDLADADYQVAVVSIAPEETPADARRLQHQLRQRQGEAVDRWQFLTGDAAAIATTAETVGFAYRYDAEQERYAHPAGLVVIAPGGTVSRYLFDVRPGIPDLKLSLLEAGQGEIGSAVQQVLLRCYRFDPETGRYNLAVIRLLQIVGGVFIAALGLLILFLRRRDPA